MIKAVKAFFQDLSTESKAPLALTDSETHLVSAALMTEVMVSDGGNGADELKKIEQILRSDFGLAKEDADYLMTKATTRVEKSTSLFEFTDQVNRHFSMAQKTSLIAHLWHIAYADNHLHKFEEATIRKLAELIHIPHSVFIRTKHIARPD
ncbi:MAG: TerB family tellurite resistance protein [Porticoccaceae bacterium]|jgi:uncharacterized tellurite resistance protein B-like protein